MKEKTLNTVLCATVALLIIFYSFFGISTTKKIDRLEKENQAQSELIIKLFDMRSSDILNEYAVDTSMVNVNDNLYDGDITQDTAQINELNK